MFAGCCSQLAGLVDMARCSLVVCVDCFVQVFEVLMLLLLLTLMLTVFGRYDTRRAIGTQGLQKQKAGEKSPI